MAQATERTPIMTGQHEASLTAGRSSSRLVTKTDQQLSGQTSKRGLLGAGVLVMVVMAMVTFVLYVGLFSSDHYRNQFKYLTF